MVKTSHKIILRYKTTWNFHVQGPFSLEHTLCKMTRFGADWYALTPFEIMEHGIYYGGFSINSFINAGIKVESPTPERIIIHLFTKSRPSAFLKEYLIRSVVQWLGIWEDLSHFYKITNKHPILKPAIEKFYGMHETRCLNLFETITFCIALQRATGGRTLTIMKNLCQEFGSSFKFDNVEVITFPTAKTISETTETYLREISPLGYRAKYVLFNSKVIRQLPVDGTFVECLEPGARMRFLSANFAGLGRYSAEILDPQGLPLDSWSASVISDLAGIKIKSGEVEPVREWFKRSFGSWSRLAMIYLTNFVCEN